MAIRHVNPDGLFKMPQAFSQVVTADAGRLVFVAGQGSFDRNGTLLHEGDVTAQLALAVANLEDALAAAGMTLADVAQLTVYALDIAATHAAHDALFGPLAAAGATPPVTLVGVQSLMVPGMAVAVDALAVR